MIPVHKLPLALIFLLMIALAGHAQEKTMVKMTTNFGEIEIEMFTEQTPNTAANFIQYVNDGFFDGLIFHRVIPGFVIQGGGFEPGMKHKTPQAPIQNEADNGLKNERGSLSMARTGDPHSATSQFFISLKDNDFLDFKNKDASGWGYAVFARVVSGMDVVDRIAQSPTGNSGGHNDVPLEDVIIEKAEVVQ